MNPSGLLRLPFLKGPARFVAASVVGLGADLCAALALACLGSLPLPAAGAVSHVAAGCLMYALHERWTFGEWDAPLSLRRLAGTLAASAGALAIRVGCLAATATGLGLGDRLALPQLVLAACLSFAFSYLVLSRVIGGANRKTTP